MTVYLTSSPTGNYRSNEPNGFEGFNPENGFTEELRSDWEADSECILIAADPDAFEINDEMTEYFASVLKKSGLTYSEFVICDHRNSARIADTIADADYILLGGGHVPTQKAFLDELRLSDRLKGFDGIVMGISAGSMNCAREIYAIPEMPGEADSFEYDRFPKGLGLTKLRIIPHYQAIKDDQVDGKRVMEEIAYTDSIGRRIIVLIDGSYILIRNGEETLCGEGYELYNGRMKKICEKEKRIKL